MPRCVAFFANGCRCTYDALPGNYKKCGHHRGEKQSAKSSKKEKKTSMSATKTLKFKQKSDGRWKMSASEARKVGYKIGDRFIDPDGKEKVMKRNVDGDYYWSSSF